jgi:hypothetical protein
MSGFCNPNIDRKGRIARAMFGVICVVSGLLLVRYSWWVSSALVAFGALGFYEAFRGWCLMRACGFKTKY